MKFISFFVSRRITTLMLNLFLVVFGILAYRHMPITLFPNSELPLITILIPYSEETPGEVEHTITKPIEEVLSTIPGLEKIESESSTGFSFIKLYFKWKTKMNGARMEIHERLKKLSLPKDIGKPLFWKWSPSEFSILEIDISSDIGGDALSEVIDYEVTPFLEELEGVSRVEIRGSTKKMIRVICNPEKLKSYGLTILNVIQALEDHNIGKLVGGVEKGDVFLNVRVEKGLENKDSIENILVLRPGLKAISLKDVALIEDTFEKPDALSRSGGVPSISLAIKKNSWANSLEVIDRIKNKVNEIQKKIPSLQMVVSKDDSIYIKDSRKIVLGNLLMGTILAALILFLFLRDVRSTLIITLSIPLAISGAGIPLYCMNISQNVFTLAGLAISAGMVVDASIVVLDNILRYYRQGHLIESAAIQGASEVALSVVASVLTTLVVFIPVTFGIRGLIGILFWDLSFALVYSLILSLFVSFTFIPMAIVVIFNFYKKIRKDEKEKIYIEHPQKFLVLIEDFFASLVGYFLTNAKQKGIFILTMYVLCFLSILLLPYKDLLPPTTIKSFTIRLEHPPNKNIEFASEEVKEVESVLIGDKSVKRVTSRMNVHESSIFISMKEAFVHKKMARLFFEKIKNTLEPKLSSKVLVYHEPELDTTEGVGYPVEVSLESESDKIRKAKTQKILDEFRHYPYVIDAKTSEEILPLQIFISTDRELMRQLGISTSYVSQLVSAYVHGKRIEQLDYDIVIQGELNQEDVKNIPVIVPVGERVIQNELRSIAAFELIEQEPLKQRSQKYSATKILAQLEIDRPALGKVLKEIESILKKLKIDATVMSSLRLLKTSFRDLEIALLLAIVLIFMILAGLFESFSQSFVIMFSIPLSLIGVLLGLRLSGHALNVSVMLGMIILVGIVVNNAIVLIDTINRSRREGQDRTPAILHAVKMRTKPILITMLTTVLGTLPLMFAKGAASEMYNGLAVVVVWGLLSSAFLTLFMIPLIYAFFEDVFDSFYLEWLKLRQKIFLPKEES